MVSGSIVITKEASVRSARYMFAMLPEGSAIEPSTAAIVRTAAVLALYLPRSALLSIESVSGIIDIAAAYAPMIEPRMNEASDAARSRK